MNLFVSFGDCPQLWVSAIPFGVRWCVSELLNPLQDSVGSAFCVPAIGNHHVFWAQLFKRCRTNSDHSPTRSFESLSLANVARRRVHAEVKLRSVELDDNLVIENDDIGVDGTSARDRYAVVIVDDRTPCRLKLMSKSDLLLRRTPGAALCAATPIRFGPIHDARPPDMANWALPPSQKRASQGKFMWLAPFVEGRVPLLYEIGPQVT
nr:hypothetical protein [Mycobacterium sp. RTGN5]